MLTCHPISAEMADNYAELKSDCESQGVPMADNDLWIAATALHLDATLVSADRDFVRVNRLRVEDWTA
jgi:tRNA(fMet)-specific endonuclease VapC